MEWTGKAVALGALASWATIASAQAVDEWTAPPEASALSSPLGAANPDQLRKGRSLFVQHCVTCHGDQGRGDGPSARLHARRSGYQPRDLSRNEVQTGLSDGEIFWKIGMGWRPRGRIVMPGVGSELSEEDRWRLVLYVRSLGQKGGGP